MAQGKSLLAIFTIMVMIGTSLVQVPISVQASTGSRNVIDFGPYLQNMTKTNVTVRWYTAIAGTTTVNYGTTTSYGNTITVPGIHNFHEVNITGLSKNTTYHYQVVTDDALSGDANFKTAIDSGDDFDFFAYGDTRTDHVAHQSVINRMALYNGEFVLNVGDIVNSGGTWSDWPPFFADLVPIGNHTFYFPVIGNHDFPIANYLNLFTLPNNEQWYSFDYGNVHIIGLETNSLASYQDGSVQQAWLRADLINASNDTRTEFIIVFFHTPPYSTGGHGNDTNVRNILCPIFKEYGVDMVISGHDHIYERYLPPDNITYVVAGGGGAPLGSVQPTAQYRMFGVSAFHFIHITVRGQVMNCTAIYPNGTAFDSWEFDKRDLTPPVKVPLTATDVGTGNTVDLNWTGYNETKEGVKSYRVFASQAPFTDSSAISFIKELGVGNQTLRLTNLTDYVQYYFAVVAEDLSGNRDPLVVPVTATPTDKEPPAPPGPPTVRDVGFTHIQFNWTASPSADVMGYLVFRNVTGTGSVPGGPYDLVATVSNTTLQYNMTGLANGTGYRFIVKAFDDAVPPNNSTASSEANATTFIPNRAPWVILQGTITMVEDQPVPGTFNVTTLFRDPDGDPLNYSVAFNGSTAMTTNVTIGLIDGKELEVVPVQDWNGAFDILVTTSDGSLTNVSAVHVTVTAVNDAPVLHMQPSYDIYEHEPAEIHIEATDIDKDVLTFTHEFPKELLPVTSDILSFDDATATLRVNASSKMIGNHTLGVIVSDGKENVSGTFIMVVINTNDPPDVPVIISPQEDQVFEFDKAVDFIVQVSDVDLMFGDKLKIEWFLDGNITPFGEGLEVLGIKGLATGDHDVTVVVMDIESLSNEAEVSFSINAKDIPPVQNKTCPDGAVVPLNGTCPKNNTTTECPGKKHPGSFLGMGLAVDYAFIAAMILLTVVVLIAAYSKMRKHEGAGPREDGPTEGNGSPPPKDEEGD